MACDGVEAQAVEVELLEPVERVVPTKARTSSLPGPSKLMASPHGVLRSRLKNDGA